MRLKTLILTLNEMLATGEAQPNDLVTFYPPFNRPVRKIAVITKTRSAAQRIQNKPVVRAIHLS